MRRRAGMSRETLARLIGVAPITVGRWERGEGRPGAWHAGLLETVGTVLTKRLHQRLQAAMVTRGEVYALYLLLDEAMG